MSPTKTKAKTKAAKRRQPAAEELGRPVDAEEARANEEIVRKAKPLGHVPTGDRQHSRGGITHLDDATMPPPKMLPGDPKEPIGPEDALGPGPKRGDYRDKLGAGYEPHQVVPIPEDEQEPGGPTARLVSQRERTENIGDARGKKGGVDTTDED